MNLVMFEYKVLLHYIDGGNEIIDEREIEKMQTKSIGTTLEKITWEGYTIEIPLKQITGKYIMRYLRDIPIKSTWYTQQKQVDIFLEFLRAGISLKQTINYLQTSTEILQIAAQTELDLIVESDKEKQCENELTTIVTNDEVKIKINKHYYNETLFLTNFVEGKLTEEQLKKRKEMEIQPTHVGKQFVNRNMPQMVGSIVRKGKSKLSEKMFELFQEYTNITTELFHKNIQTLMEKWKAEGDTELVRLAAEYINLSGNISLNGTKMSSLEMIDTELLKRWTGMRNFTVVFEKAVSEIDMLQFNQSICGRKNMMIIAFSDDGNIFGSYSSIEIPQPVNWIKKDAGHFVFTLTNHQNVQPTRFFPLKLGNSVYIFANDYMISVVAVQGAFKINLRTASNFSSKFGSYYNDSVGLGASVFVKNPDKYTVKNLIVLEFY